LARLPTSNRGRPFPFHRDLHFVNFTLFDAFLFLSLSNVNMPTAATTPNAPATVSSLLCLATEIRYMIFDRLLEERVVDLGEKKNKDGTFKCNSFISLSRKNRTLHSEVKSWSKGIQKLHLLSAAYSPCGFFDPQTTIFLTDLSFPTKHKHLGSFVMYWNTVSGAVSMRLGLR
jgi:hypothetical protein